MTISKLRYPELPSNLTDISEFKRAWNELIRTLEHNDALTSEADATGFGFIDYNDTSTTSSPLVLSAGVWTTVPNNGLGVNTNKLYKPEGVTELLDVADGHITPQELTLGSSLLIRNDLEVTPSTNNQLFEVRYSLGTGGGVYTLPKTVGRLDSGSSQPYRFSLEPDYIYMGDGNTRDNDIILQVRTSGSGTLINFGSAIQVIGR